MFLFFNLKFVWVPFFCIRMNYRYIDILVKIGTCVGTLAKSEIPIREKRVRLAPPDATITLESTQVHHLLLTYNKIYNKIY